MPTRQGQPGQGAGRHAPSDLLVEYAPIGMCEVSRDGTLLWANQATADMLGYENPAELLEPPPGQRPGLFDAPLFAALSRPGLDPVETEWPRKDGHPVLVRLRGWQTSSSHGLPARLAVIAEDITERRELEDRLRLAHQLEAVGRLAGGIAHDFNNMLTAILGYSELLLQQLDEDKPIYEDLREIGRAAARAASLTRQLLTFSRQHVVALETLDLNVVVADVERMVRRLIGDDITVESRLTASLPAITADRGLIEQVIVNLALNARDAMPQGGVLTIATRRATIDELDGPSRSGVVPCEPVELVVSDTGVGMSAEVRSKIFDPFFTTKKRGQGTGLGLASVYSAVQQLGGRIRVHSEPNQGAVFTLSFPGTSRATARPFARTTRQGQPVGSESVLLVEDEPTVRAFCRSVLERHGYRVTESTQPSEAFQAVDTTTDPVDLILTDVTMPGMNGYDMVRRLRKSRPGFRAIYMSGYISQFSERGIDADAASDLIEKPFTAAELLRRVRAALDRPN